MPIRKAIQIATLLVVVVGSLLYLWLKRADGMAIVTKHETALTALSELRQWGTFLIGLQTGSITLMGFLFEKVSAKHDERSPLLTPDQSTLGVLTVILFGGSIFTATWLLGAIPSLMLRLKDCATQENDFFHLALFQSLTWPEVGPMTGLMFALFSVGIVFLSIFALLRLRML